MDRGFLTVNEVSQYLNVKSSTLYSWVKTKEIPCYKVHKLIRFKKEDVDVWMETHKEKMEDLDPIVKKVLYKEFKI